MKTTLKGQQTEQACCRYLQRKGLKLVEQNYRTRTGEIDLIMHDRSMLVFIEVRYRKNSDYGSAIESVDQAKQLRIIRTAEHYCQQHDIDSPLRIDIVGMQGDNEDGYRFEWIKNAITV